MFLYVILRLNLSARFYRRTDFSRNELVSALPLSFELSYLAQVVYVCVRVCPLRVVRKRGCSESCFAEMPARMEALYLNGVARRGEFEACE